LLGTDEESAAEQLSLLRSRELVEAHDEPKLAGEVEHTFRHALVREAAYTTLTDADRTLGHRLAGEWLERVGESDALVLAEHFERGKEPARAIRWYRQAAEQALGANDLQAAVARVDRAVACGASGEDLARLRLTQALALRWLGDYERTAAAASESLAIFPRGSAEWYGAAAPYVLAVAATGRRDQILPIVAEARDFPADAVPSAAQVLLWGTAAPELYFGGMYAEADFLIRLVGRAEGTLSDHPIAEARFHRAHAAYHGARVEFSQALRHLHQSTRVFERAGDARNVCLERMNSGFRYMQLGAWADAEVVLDVALQQAELLALPYLIGAVKGNIAYVHGARGDAAGGQRLIEETLAIFEGMKEPRMVSSSRVYLAWILANAPEPDLARAAGQAELAVAEAGTTDPPVRVYALGVLAWTNLRRGEVAAALASAERAMVELEQLGTLDEGEGVVRLVHIEALLASGARAAAAAAARAARDRLVAVADKIDEPAQRRSFLEDIMEHARILQHATELG
jgi:hypothetical protein